MTAGRPNWILPFLATIFAMMTMQMSSLGFSPLIPTIQDEFKMTYTQVGLFTGMYGLVAIVMSIPGGLLARWFGEKRALASGLIVTAVGLGLLSIAPNFPAALSGRALWIIGYRVSFVCVMTAIAFTAPPALKGSAMGILGSMSSLATVIGAPFGTAIGTEYGWRNGIRAFAAMALLGAAVFFLLYHRLSDKPVALRLHTPSPLPPGPAPVGDPAADGLAGSPFRSPIIWSLVLLGTINMGGFSATFFVPSAVKMFEQPAATMTAAPPVSTAVETASAPATAPGREKPSVLATRIISTSYIFAIFANLLFGYLCDRFNRWNMMLAIPVILVPACFTMMIPNLAVFWVSTALLIGLGLCATNQLYTLAGELVGGKNLATVMGIASLGGGVFGYVGPQALGFLRSHTGGYTAGWWFVAAGVVVSFAELVVLKRHVVLRDRRARARSQSADLSALPQER